ncbi:hypothetical protein HWV62_27811 [Athelia sp. TMB]|nr:hypothetical protein HWV62_27811 [Athelia sp. TMB]
MDTTHQQLAGDMSGFQPAVSGSSHDDLNIPSRDMSTVFPTKTESSANDFGSSGMHLSRSDILNASKISSMDFLDGSNTARVSAPGLIPDFSSATGFENRPTLDSHPTSYSSSSGTSISSVASLASSPAMQGITPNYNGTSSLSSALDAMGTRSRSGSSASPGTFAPVKSDFTFSPAANGPLHSAQDFLFPPNDLGGSASEQQKSMSPEAPADSHLLAIGGLLTNISKQATSARDACAVGNGDAAGVRIDELKRTIALVADLLAATKLGDSPPAHSTPPSYSSIGSNSGNPSTEMGNGGVSHEHHSLTLPAYTSHLHPKDEMQGVLDSGDGSRKRCASSMAGDRVVKSLKLEPQDDIPLHGPSTQANGSHMPSSSSYPSMPPFNSSASSSSSSTSRPGSPTHAFDSVVQPKPHSFNFGDIDLTSPTSMNHSDFNVVSKGSSASTPTHAATVFPSPPANRISWSDGHTGFPSRHHHTSSGSSISNGVGLHGPGSSSAALPFTAPGAFGSAPNAHHTQQRSSAGLNGVSISPTSTRPIGRLSRSGSVSGAVANPFAFGQADIHAQEAYTGNYVRPSNVISTPHTPASSPEADDDYESNMVEDHPRSQSPSGASSSRGRRDSRADMSRPVLQHNAHSSAEGNGGGVNSGNEVPQEYRGEVDRIFFEFLEAICSNLDATDSKGEPIHQTLMAKKMQRLDESPEFRPFKFRIQAFTNAFLEELARQGYPEEKIPMKKTYISRFNEDGKKAKSKGNHIWNINAKKKAEGGWLFSPFHRRLAGTPHGVAYVGLRWTWAPRIWDPQASRSNMPVEFTSPNLPRWLLWKDEQLSGIPPPDAESCDITVEARFNHDGKDELLTQTVHVNIAPMSTLDTSFSTSRRPSLISEVTNPRRVTSDSAVPQLIPPRPLIRAQTTLAPPPPVVSSANDAQVLQVLNSAAQRVAQEVKSQVIGSRPLNEAPVSLELLAKQQHVLSVTAQALGETLDHNNAGTNAGPSPQASQVRAMASAAQQVVLQAARTVTADRTALNTSLGIPSSQEVIASQVTVNEVSVATQDAVAKAVNMSGPLSSEVNILMHASSLLQQKAQESAPVPSPPATFDASRFIPPDIHHPSFPIATGTTGMVPPYYPPPSTSVGLQDYTPL